MKKDLTMEVRLLIAFVLMGLVLLVSQYFIKPAPAPTATKEGAAKSAQPVTPAAVEKPAVVIPSSAKQQATDTQNEVQAAGEETIPVDTDVYHVVFSNRGAVVRSWVLKDFKDHTGKSLELVYQPALGRVPAPLAVEVKGQTLATDPNKALFKTERSGDGLAVSFEFSDGRALTKKTFHFAQKSYLVGVTSEITQNGTAVPHLLTWRGGFGDPTVRNPVSVEHALYYDLANSKLQQKSASDAKNGPVSASGQFSFVGIEDSYFTAVFLPGDNKQSVEETTFADAVPDAEGKDEKRVGVGVGGDGLNEFSLFVGPKDTDLLTKVNPKLVQVVDWGFFGVIAKPLFLVLNWTSDHLVHNYGWSIVLVTLAINMLLFPLKITSMKSSKKMQALQPQIKAINDRYKGISMKDPRKTEQNQEVMDLYKKNGVNPVGGCLPMLLQLPFLWAFYKVLGVAIEMRGSHWLWVTDLSQPESLAIHLLPVLLVVTQFAMQRMTPQPGVDPAQAKMMMFMPLMFGYMFYFASAGLVLYWLTGNVVGIVQQWLLNKTMPTPPAPAVVPVKKGRK
ncbi:MAG: membrane protein insertase YidC [Acidobacteriota bacterium]